MSENLTPVTLYGLTYYEYPLGPYQGINREEYMEGFDNAKDALEPHAPGGLICERNYTQRLNDEIKSIEAQLERKKRLQKLLADNPVIREALELMN